MEKLTEEFIVKWLDDNKEVLTRLHVSDEKNRLMTFVKENHPHCTSCKHYDNCLTLKICHNYNKLTYCSAHEEI